MHLKLKLGEGSKS